MAVVVNRALWVLISCGQGRDAGMGTQNTQTNTLPPTSFWLCAVATETATIVSAWVTRLAASRNVNVCLFLFRRSVTCVTDEGYARPLSKWDRLV